MDKTKRLIRWQRVTIGVLCCVLGLCALKAHRQEGEFHEQAIESAERADLQRYRDDLARNTQREHDAQIINELGERLKKYEAKYGPIEPIRKRKGEGVYFGRNITRGALPSR